VPSNSCSLDHISHVRCISFPSILCGRTSCSLSNQAAPVHIVCEPRKPLRQSFCVRGIFENQTIRTVMNDCGAAAATRSDHGQTASHGFEDADAEGFLADRRLDIDVRVTQHCRQLGMPDPPGQMDPGGPQDAFGGSLGYAIQWTSRSA